MSDLKELIHELSHRQMTRKQFLALVGGSFLGILGVFRLLELVNMPKDNLAHSDKAVFGEGEYGHPPGQPSKAHKRFDEEVFG